MYELDSLVTKSCIVLVEQQQLGVVVVAGCCWLRVAAMLEPRSGQTVVIADLCPACELVMVGGGGADNAFLAGNTTTTTAGTAQHGKQPAVSCTRCCCW